MKIELILLGIIGAVFLIDFLMRGIKKKPSSTEVDIKEEEDFKNIDNKPKKKISLFGLVIVVLIGIPISLLGSYLVALYFGQEYRFLANFYVDSDFIDIIQTHNFLNCLIFFSIYLVFITIVTIVWNKTKRIWDISRDFKFILKRKKNITLFTLSLPILKIILHYLFYPETNSSITGSLSGPGFGRGNTYGDPYRESIGEHINVLFDKELFLFIPAIIIIILIAWFFNDKIKAR